MTSPILTPASSPLQAGSVLGEGSHGRLFKTRGPLDPINDQAIYVERPECAQIVSLARSGTVDNYIALLAARQSGKTTLLYRTRQELLAQNSLGVAFVDLQGLSVEDESSAYGYVADQMAREWQRDPRFDVSSLPKVTHGPSFRQFLLQVAQQHRATRLIVLLDEVGAFPARFSDGFFGTIRNVFSNRHKSSEDAFAKYLFIFSGAVDLHTLTSGANSPLNICDKIFLRDLTASGVRHLTDLLARRGAVCASEVSATIYAQTGGHPYLTQRICAILEEHADGPVTREHVDVAVGEMMRGDDNLNHITRALDQDAEAKELTQRIVVRGEKIPFSRVNPSVGRLETIGVVRAAGNVCKVRNDIYLRALRTYFGAPTGVPLSLRIWLRRLLPIVGILLLIASLPTAYVFVNDVMFAPPAITHKVDLKKPGVDVTVSHPTVIKDLTDAVISIQLIRSVPMAALTVTVTTSDPEIIIREKTRFVVMRGEDEHKEFTAQLARSNYWPNLINPVENRRSVNLTFTTPDGNMVTSTEEFHNDIVQTLGIGTLTTSAIGLLLTISQIVGYFELAKALPKRLRIVAGLEGKK